MHKKKKIEFGWVGEVAVGSNEVIDDTFVLPCPLMQAQDRGWGGT